MAVAPEKDGLKGSKGSQEMVMTCCSDSQRQLAPLITADPPQSDLSHVLASDLIYLSVGA